MSRPDSKFTAAGEEPLDPAELLAVFEEQLANAKCDRRDAIARYLAAGPDWREAGDRLGGAFAEPPADRGLSGRKGS